MTLKGQEVNVDSLNQIANALSSRYNASTLKDSMEFYADNDFEKSINYGLALINSIDTEISPAKLLSPYNIVLPQLIRAQKTELNDFFSNKAIATSEEFNLPVLKAMGLISLSGVTSKKYGPENASELLHEALVILKEHPHEIEMLARLRLYFFSLNYGFKKQAKDHLSLAGKLVKKYPDNRYLGYYYLLKSISFNDKQLDSIKFYKEQGIEVLKKKRFNTLLSYAYTQFASTYIAQKDFKNAKIYLDKVQPVLNENYPAGYTYYSIVASNYYLNTFEIENESKINAFLDVADSISTRYKFNGYYYYVQKYKLHLSTLLDNNPKIWDQINSLENANLKIHSEKIQNALAYNEVFFNTELLTLKAKNAEEKFAFEHKKTMMLYVATLLLLLLCVLLVIYILTKNKQKNKLKAVNKELLQKELEMELQSNRKALLVDQLTQSIVTIEESNKKLLDFGETLIHDLITPINSMVMFSTILKKKFGDVIGKEGESFLNYLHTEGKSVIALITEILDTSKTNTDVLPYKVDLNKILFQAENHLRYNIFETKASVIQKNDLGGIVGYDSEMLRVFVNIITNALRFKSENKPPIIEVSKHEDDMYMTLLFKDNGVGIRRMETKYSPEALENFQGTGLKTCVNILKNYAGELSTRMGENGGSIIKITLKKERIKKAYTLESPMVNGHIS